MARYKITDKEAPNGVGYGVEYIVNPSGVIWAVHEDHPAPDWFPRTPEEAETPLTLVRLAESRQAGWRLASEDEIRKYAKENGEWLPPELDQRGPGRPPKAGVAE